MRLGSWVLKLLRTRPLGLDSVYSPSFSLVVWWTWEEENEGSRDIKTSFLQWQMVAGEETF